MAELTRVTKGDLWIDTDSSIGRVICKLHKIRIELENGEVVKLNYRQFRERFKPYVLVAKERKDDFTIIGCHWVNDYGNRR